LRRENFLKDSNNSSRGLGRRVGCVEGIIEGGEFFFVRSGLSGEELTLLKALREDFLRESREDSFSR
jgi:hypothetical protein